MLHVICGRRTLDIVLLLGKMGVTGISERPLIIFGADIFQDADTFADCRN